jgi:hypothetical protein
LKRHHRLTILAPPGGGKSTLLRRLALAYTDRARRGQVDDGLPELDWLPILLRCRDLRGRGHLSFAELLKHIASQPAMQPHEEVFLALAERSLRAGRLLLLVDGLDELTDPADRAAFVSTVRAVLLAYPSLSIVMTSREAGCRHIASYLAPLCKSATLSSFDDHDIKALILAWHREVLGASIQVRETALALARAIQKNDRIRRLGSSPLLLIILLLVKRWVGSLPERRSALYGSAVDVLLRTWNVEGHKPMRLAEAALQLRYVAFHMMHHRMKRISRPTLVTLLHEARESYPAALGRTLESFDEFVERVEDRSSLLMLTGHDIEHGQLVEFFEFRHLTFQEFMAAQALVEGRYQGARSEHSLATRLTRYFEDPAWREVISLACVLAREEESDGLIVALTDDLTQKIAQGRSPAAVAEVLGMCLADEAAATPENAQRAIEALVHGSAIRFSAGFVESLCTGLHGALTESTTWRLLTTAAAPSALLRTAFGAVVWYRLAPRLNETRVEDIARKLRSSDRYERVVTVCMMEVLVRFTALSAPDLTTLQSTLLSSLGSEDAIEAFAAVEALRSCHYTPLEDSVERADLVTRLYALARRAAELQMTSSAGEYVKELVWRRVEGRPITR